MAVKRRPRGSGRRSVGKLSVAVVLSLTASVLAIGTGVEPAAAGVHNPIPADISGDPSYDFTDADALFAYATVDTKGGKLCVVRRDTPLFAATCKRPAWGTPNHLVGIGTMYTLLEGRDLAPGEYRVLAEDSKGKPLALSEIFTVRPCKGAACDRTLTNEVVNKWKASAYDAGRAATLACSAMKLWKLYKTYKDGVKERPLLETLAKDPNVREYAQDGRDKVIEVTAGAASGGSPGARAGATSEQATSALLGDLVMALVADVLTFESAEERAKAMLNDLVCQVGVMYDDIYHDPPDPNFGSVQPPAFATIAPLAPAPADPLAAALDRQTGFGLAALKGYERYLGAQAAGDVAGIHRQTRAAADDTFAMIDELRNTADALRTYATTVEQYPDGADALVPDQAARDDLVAVYQRVQTSGFTAGEIAQLQTLGLSQTEIDDLRSQFAGDPSALPIGVSGPEMLRQLATRLEGAVPGLDGFARNAAVVAGRTHVPLPAGDQYSVNEDAPLVVPAPGVLANDADTDSSPLTVTGSTQPAHGTVTVTPTGGFTYTPASNYNGPDSFTYTVDNGDFTATASVSIDVLPVADPPTANADNYTTPVDVPLVVPAPGVKANDANIDGAATLTVTIATPPSHGSVTLDTDGGFTYTPTGGYAGDDSFTYTLSNGTLTSVGSVLLTIQAGIAQPVANPDTYLVSVGSYILTSSPGVRANDTGITGGIPAQAVLDTQPLHASYFDFIANGSLFYIPAGGFSGTDSFTYHVVDGGFSSAPTTVTFLVGNQPPKVAAFVQPQANIGESVSMVAGASDPDGDDLTYSWTFGDGSTGTGAHPIHTYASPGVYTATVTGNDGHGHQITATAGTVEVGPYDPGQFGNQGRSFSLGFGHNFEGQLAEPKTLTLSITGPTDAAGKVVIPGLGFEAPFTVLANQVVTVALPEAATTGRKQPDPFGINIGIDPYSGVAPLGVFVRSDQPVAVYGMNRMEASTDAFLGLPEHSLGVDHLDLSYQGLPPYADGSQMVVVASQNGTTVTITPSSSIGPGFTPGVPFTVSLDKGDIYRLITKGASYSGTPPFVDVTGTTVVSDKPIALFGGHTCANVPVDVKHCDHLTEQLPPTSQWGQHFLTEPLRTRFSGDTFRVLAAQDGTEVSINGSVVATLDRGEFDERILTGASRIDTSKPAIVAQYANGNDYDGVVADPFMMLIPPTDQFQADYTVTTPASGISKNFINLVAPSSIVGQLTLDGAPVPAGAFTAIAGSTFVSAQLAVSIGSHHLAAPKPFGAYVYGFDAYDSYGYPAGLAVGPVASTTTLILTPPTQVVAQGAQACVDASVGGASGALEGVRVDFAVTGANTADGFTFSDAGGGARYCYTATKAGADALTANVGYHTANANVTVGAVNHSPSASDNHYVLAQATSLAVGSPGVLGNDHDPDGDVLVTTGVQSPPAHGSVTLSPDGTFTYTPDDAFFGGDTFTYGISDGHGGVAAAKVDLDVHHNSSPSASPDSYSVASGGVLTVAAPGVLGNDSDPDGDGLWVEDISSDVTHGSLDTEPAGGFTYTPAPGYSGTDTFTYTVTDGHGAAASAVVSITVTAVPHPPVAQADSYPAIEDTTLSIAAPGVLGNDSDPDGDPITAQVVSTTTHGVLSLAGNGSFTYQPVANYAGPDAFTYRASDGSLQSAPVTVDLNVQAVNDAPVGTADAYTAHADVPLTVAAPGVLGNDTDIEGDALLVASSSQPGHGSVTVAPAGSFTYVPAPGYVGADSFTYVPSDGVAQGSPTTVTITVSAVNHAPAATDDVAKTKADTPLTIDVLANDTDADGDALVIQSVGTPAHGSAVAQSGKVLYTPSNGYLGLDSFTYTVADPVGATATGTVSLTVGPTGAAFHPVTPFRILDSRTPVGGFGGPVGQNQAKTLHVGGVGGIPVNASAVVMNVTATVGTRSSYVQLYPTGAPRPLTANVLFGRGQTIPNLATVGLGSNGDVDVYNQLGSVDVVADVVGWYDDGSGTELFHSMNPERFLDSRTDIGGWSSTPIGEGQTRALHVAGAGSVPATASAVIMNVTATAGTKASYLQAFPAGVTKATTANLLFGPGQTIPNLVIVAIGAGGDVNLFNQRGAVHVTADVVGWFGPGDDGRWFHPVTPTRLLDSRTGTGGWSTPLGPAESRLLQVTGTGVVPPDAIGFVSSMTATMGTRASYLQMYPAGAVQPTTANVLLAAGQTIPNMVTGSTGAGGAVAIFNQRGFVDVVVDLSGYYALK